MIPQEFLTFFAASVTADGALIGLLFVAISIEPEHTFGPEAKLERELAANGAFAGLINAFLISMIALIPNLNIGWAVVVIAAISLLNTLVHAVDKLRRGQQAFMSSLLFTIGGLLIYGLEIIYGVQLIQQPHNTDGLYSLIFVLVADYGVVLARSWTLLGGERRTLSRLLLDAVRERRLRTPASSSTHVKKKAPPSV